MTVETLTFIVDELAQIRKELEELRLKKQIVRMGYGGSSNHQHTQYLTDTQTHDFTGSKHDGVSVSNPTEGQLLGFDSASNDFKNLDPLVTITGSDITLSVTGSISNTSFGFSGSVALISSGSATVLSVNSGAKIIDSGSGLKIKIYDAGFVSFAGGVKYLYFGTTTGSTQSTRLLSFSGSGTVHQTFIQPRISASGDALFLISNVAETVAVPYDFGYVLEA